MISAVDTLRSDPDFAETTGEEARIMLPGGTFAHYVPAKPGAAWALDLAFLAQGAIIPGTPPRPGLISRVLFRRDVEPDALASTLIDGAAHALERGYASFPALEQELERGRSALTGLSRNARTRDAWLLVAALRSVTRPQISRALGLSRAGGDIQARALSHAGLVSLSAAGRVRWQAFSSEQAPLLELDGSLGEATAGLDQAMARIDQLLARHTPKANEGPVS